VSTTQSTRLAGSDVIEVSDRDVALLGQFGFIPSRTQQPLAGVQLSGACGYEAANLRDAGDRAEIERSQMIHAAFREVNVRIDQAGSRCASVEIDHAGRAVGQRENLRVRSQGYQTAIADG
jgi:hypothetical protein